MEGLPIISHRSKALQLDLGVTTCKSAMRKLLAFGAHVIDGEYFLKQEITEIARRKIDQSNNIHRPDSDVMKGSSFTEYM